MTKITILCGTAKAVPFQSVDHSKFVGSLVGCRGRRYRESCSGGSAPPCEYRSLGRERVPSPGDLAPYNDLSQRLNAGLSFVVPQSGTGAREFDLASLYNGCVSCWAGRSLPVCERWAYAQAAQVGRGKSELHRAVCRITSGGRPSRAVYGKCHRKYTAPPNCFQRSECSSVEDNVSHPFPKEGKGWGTHRSWDSQVIAKRGASLGHPWKWMSGRSWAG